MGIIFLAVIVFASGFYFGFKTQQNSNNTDNLNLESTKLSNTSGKMENSNVISKEVEAIFWIKPSQEPVCPNTHPIKGTFGVSVANYYTPDSKNYKRINPDICFTNETYARDQAGFIKKF